MQAAMCLALRGGFAAMTVRQIAREAGSESIMMGELAEPAGFHPPDPRDARHAAGG